MKVFKALLFFAGLMCLSVSPANALRWVASNGNDAGACTRAAPCLTFTRAILVGGGEEIRCVDSGNFGTIGVDTLSLTINCEEHIATVSSIGSTIDNISNQIVVLRGIDFDAGGTVFAANTSALAFVGSGTLELHNVSIKGFRGQAVGIRFLGNGGPAKLLMSGSTVSDNGGGNILVKPAAPVAVQAIFDNVTSSSSIFGFRIDGTGAAGGSLDVEIRNSVAANNTSNGFLVVSNFGQMPTRVVVDGSSAFNNTSSGAVATGASAVMLVADSVFSKNGNGIAQQNESNVGSTGDNVSVFNTLDTSGTLTPVPFH